MFQEYLYEIIASIAVLVLITIYILIKFNPSNSKKEITMEEVPTHTLDEKPEETQEESTPITNVMEDEYDQDFSGSEEGDFGEPEPIENTQEERESIIHKRDVPSHDKITKQNFSEFSGERLLVAEDNLINQKVISGLLAGSGIEVVLADDGQIALDILEKDSDFLMVLMDAHMPRVDGFEATRAIRANPKYDHILVVALSGDTASDDIAKMKDAGMAEQLEKPLRMEALYDILYAYTGNEKIQESSDEELIEVVMTRELNGDKGLEICGGDEGFYREILQEFINDYSDSSQKLQNFIQSAKMQEADKLLLDIIGVTSNIGADKLHNVASNIKSALSNSKKESYSILLDQYDKDLETLIEDINNYL
ncbi:MAG: response regulator [Campylobacterota bacterium]|nr:response regulator [Campylobacterota bacterium]